MMQSGRIGRIWNKKNDPANGRTGAGRAAEEESLFVFVFLPNLRPFLFIVSVGGGGGGGGHRALSAQHDNGAPLREMESFGGDGKRERERRK